MGPPWGRRARRCLRPGGGASGPTPATWARARSLLWAASRLCDFALGWGHEPEPCVLLQGALIERFIVRGTPGWSAAARRTVRSNLLFLAHRFFASAPEPVPLSRERAQAPYSEAELARLSGPGRRPAHCGAPGQSLGADRARGGGGIDRGRPAGGHRRRRRCSLRRSTRRGARPSAPDGPRARRAVRARPCGSSMGQGWVHRGRGRAQPAQRHESPHRLARRGSRSAPALPRPSACDVGGPLCG